MCYYLFINLLAGNYKGGWVVFNFLKLIESIYRYGFIKFSHDSDIELNRLIMILDGQDMFEGDEIIRAAKTLNIHDSKVSEYFFETKIA